MSRDLDGQLSAQFSASFVRLCFFVELLFDGLSLRLWDGIGDISWNDQTWRGNGWLSGIRMPREVQDVRAEDSEIQLSGIPVEIRSAVLSSARLTSTGSLYVGVLDDRGALIGTPYRIFERNMDAPNIKDSGDSSTIKITFESELAVLKKAKELRYTHECQRSMYPDDQGFAYVARLKDWNGYWGKQK